MRHFGDASGVLAHLNGIPAGRRAVVIVDAAAEPGIGTIASLKDSVFDHVPAIALCGPGEEAKAYEAGANAALDRACWETDVGRVAGAVGRFWLRIVTSPPVHA